jgi:exonuclease VII small subunit
MPDTVYVAADAGRPVQRVDTGCFTGKGDITSEKASAFHAQAASFVEALEAGAGALALSPELLAAAEECDAAECREALAAATAALEKALSAAGDARGIPGDAEDHPRATSAGAAALEAVKQLTEELLGRRSGRKEVPNA